MRLPNPRSLLFVPGSRLDMIAKVAKSSPDVAVIDLEDAVPAPDKETARETTRRALAETDFSSTAVLVRINPAGTPWFTADLAMVAGAGIGAVLPKYERAEQVAAVRSELGDTAGVLVGLETARGVADARDLLAADVDGAYFGAEDYIADIGGRRTTAGTEVLYARSQVCLAAYLAGVPALDQAVVAVRDEQRFQADAQEGKAIGYRGKICVHPRQVELAHAVFTPSVEEIAHSEAVLAAAESGVAVVDGQMVDDVHVRMARAVLERVRR